MFKLAFINVSRRKKNTFLMILITAITVMIFVSIWNIYTVTNSGIDISEEKMGADILIYSEKAQGSAQDILFTGAQEMTYINKEDVLSEIPYDCVEQLTCEFYVQTLPSEGCCSTDESIRIVGIDTENDFLVTPWLNEENLPMLTEEEMIVGCNVKMEQGVATVILKQFFEVKGKLYQTGTGLDDSLFVNIDKARQMAETAFTKDYFDNQETEELVSSCFIKLKDDCSVDEFLEKFDSDKVGAKVATISEERETIRQQNLCFTRILWIFWGAILVIAVIALFSQYYETIRERRKEIGYLRAVGMKKTQVVLCSVLEGCMQGGIGGLVGAILGSVLYRYLLDVVSEVYTVVGGNLSINVLVVHALCGVIVAMLLSAVGSASMTLTYVKEKSSTTLIEGDVE